MRSVKDNITVCVIMNDQNIILTSQTLRFLRIIPGVAMLPTGLDGRETTMYLAFFATSSGISFTYGRKSCSATSG